MNLKARIERLVSEAGRRPGPPVLPGASAEDVALAILDGSIRPQGLDERDPRQAEAVTKLVAALHVAESYLANPAMYRAPMSCPRLIAACERALASNPEPQAHLACLEAPAA